jgi:hypothetical protein
MSNEKLHARFGVQLAPWQAALDSVCDQIAATSNAARAKQV